MGYADIAALQQDADFNVRTQACYATETLEVNGALDPGSWTAQHSWDMAAQPGFGDAYASAVAGQVPRPGNDASVISDAQILGAVQSLLPAPPVVEPQDEPDPAP